MECLNEEVLLQYKVSPIFHNYIFVTKMTAML